MTASPELRAAMRWLDLAKEQGFGFERVGFSQDAPLRGKRETTEWIDEIVVIGFSDSCEATRRRRYSLICLGDAGRREGHRGRVDGPAYRDLRLGHHLTAEWNPDDRL
jgi:hypothetical protein